MPAAAVVIYFVIDCISSSRVLLASVPAGTRESLFVSLSATAGALLGFAITGLTILLSLGAGPRLNWLRENQEFRVEVRHLFITAIASLGIATVAFLMLLVVATSRDSFPVIWGCITAGLVALIVERVWRLVAFFNRLLPIALKDADGKRFPNPVIQTEDD